VNGSHTDRNRRPVEQWAAIATARHRQIEAVWLCGSRALGAERPDSDYDVLVALGDASYDEHSAQREQIEQRIAFDPALRRPDFDLFFLRPRGQLGRWEFGPDDPCPAVDGDSFADEDSRDCLLHGCPPDDWSRFFKDLRDAVLIWPAPREPEAGSASRVSAS